MTYTRFQAEFDSVRRKANKAAHQFPKGSLYKKWCYQMRFRTITAGDYDLLRRKLAAV
jgi:hypothetical protein